MSAASTVVKGKDKPAPGTVRTVCCAIPVDPTSGEVLMVTSRKHATKWIFPKGGLEKHETLVQAAIREAWEEAGTPEHLPHTSADQAPVYSGTCLTKDEERTINYHIFELEVRKEDLRGDWLEQSERIREWVPPTEALRRCNEWAYKPRSKIELGEGLKRCRVYERAVAGGQ